MSRLVFYILALTLIGIIFMYAQKHSFGRVQEDFEDDSASSQGGDADTSAEDVSPKPTDAVAQPPVVAPQKEDDASREGLGAMDKLLSGEPLTSFVKDLKSMRSDVSWIKDHLANQTKKKALTFETFHSLYGNP